MNLINKNIDVCLTLIIRVIYTLILLPLGGFYANPVPSNPSTNTINNQIWSASIEGNFRRDWARLRDRRISLIVSNVKFVKIRAVFFQLSDYV